MNTILRIIAMLSVASRLLPAQHVSRTLPDSIRRIALEASRLARDCRPESLHRAGALWLQVSSLAAQDRRDRASWRAMRNAWFAYNEAGDVPSGDRAFERLIAMSQRMDPGGVDSARLERASEQVTVLERHMQSVTHAYGGAQHPIDSLGRARQEQLDASERVPDVTIELRLRAIKALALERTGDLAGARTTLLTNVKAADDAMYFFFEGQSLVAVGNLDVVMMRPDSAYKYLRRAASLYQAAGDSVNVARARARLGYLFRTFRAGDSARIALTLAVPVLEQSGDPRTEYDALLDLAQAYRQLGDEPSAQRTYHAAIRILRRGLDEGLPISRGDRDPCALPGSDTYAPPAEMLALMRDDRSVFAGELGTLYFALARYDSAALYLDSARAMTHGMLAATMANLSGLAHRDLGQAAEARQRYIDARRLSQASGERLTASQALAGLAMVAMSTGTSAGLAEATADFDSAASLKEAVFRRTPGDVFRVSLAESDAPMFDDWALTWLQLATLSPTDSAAARFAALAAVERGRGQALRDLMGDTTVRHQPGGTLSDEGERLTDHALTRAVAILSYLVAARETIVWLVQPGRRLTIARVAVPADTVMRRVVELRRGLGVDQSCTTMVAVPASAVEKSLRLVRDIVLPASIRAALPDSGEIVVVPHGPLQLVPYAALPTDTADADRLGTRYALRYTPSLEVLEIAEQGGSEPPSDNLVRLHGAALVLANPTMPTVAACGERLPLDPLPAAESSARRLARRLGVTLYDGTTASRANVLSHAAAARVIHFGTHGYAFPEEGRARDSWIALAPAAGDSGFLTVGNVLDHFPRLRAELVLLSACRTGLGYESRSEGTIGLPRAFLARGARSVIMSLWDISSVATAELTDRFYDHWLTDHDHPDKAEALRRAQVEVSQSRRDPIYWSGFRLVGAN